MKIYYAVRVPFSRFNEFSCTMDGVMFSQITEYVRKFMHWEADVVERFSQASVLLYEGRERLHSFRTSPLATDFDFCFMFMLHDDGFVYIRPQGTHGLCTGFMQSIPGYAEEFGYWDSADMPDHITEGAWLDRKRVWEGLYGEDGLHKRLPMYRYVVVAFQEPYGVDRFYNTLVWEPAQALARKEVS